MYIREKQKKVILNRGLGLLEVVVGIGLITTGLIGVVAGLTGLVHASLLNTKKVQAVYLLEEGAEAVRSIRDASWDTIASLSTETEYFLYFDSGNWEATTTPEYIDTLLRTVTFLDVFRDGNSDISESGTLDPEIRKISLDVAWPEQGATTTRSEVLYLTNLFDE
jgi:hypothetical protein